MSGLALLAFAVILVALAVLGLVLPHYWFEKWSKELDRHDKKYMDDYERRRAEWWGDEK